MLILFVMYYLDPFLACYFYCTFILFILFSLSFCVNISDIPMHYMTACCMTTFLLCDYVVCLWGAHIYLFISNHLVLVYFIPLDLVFDMRLATLFAFRPS